MMFYDEEIEALVLGLRDVQTIGDPALAAAAATALTKLHARLPSAQAHRLKHAVSAVNRIYRPPQPTIDVVVLRRATWEERTVAFGYTDGKGAVTHREIDPLGTIFLQDRHCVLGWCHLRHDSRVFRLDRMRDLVVTAKSFRPKRVPMLQTALEKIRAEVAEQKAASAGGKSQG